MSTIIEEQTLKITRRIKAPRERVFSAFTTPEAISEWFAPKPGKIGKCESDFRVGGSYRFLGSCTGEQQTVATGVYREITPPSKISYTWRWENDEEWDNVESLVTFEFKAVGDETELVLTHTGFPSDESRNRHGEGWGACVNKLDSILTGSSMPDIQASC